MEIILMGWHFNRDTQFARPIPQTVVVVPDPGPINTAEILRAHSTALGETAREGIETS